MPRRIVVHLPGSPVRPEWAPAPTRSALAVQLVVLVVLAVLLLGPVLR